MYDLKKPHSIEEIAEKHDEDVEFLTMQLAHGTTQEMEHTKNAKTARTIALYHLWEHPRYYIQLEKMEKNSFKDGGQVNADNPTVKAAATSQGGATGGLLVGNRHSEGGIKAVNKSNGRPLEMEGGEIVITRNAVSDGKKRLFEGQMLTNRQILSKINEGGGGVSFAEGGELPSEMHYVGKEYKYGGGVMHDHDIVKDIIDSHERMNYGIPHLELPHSEALDKLLEGKTHDYKHEGQFYKEGGMVRLVDFKVPTYVHFSDINKEFRQHEMMVHYKNHLKNYHGVDYNSLPHELQTGLLLGNQKLIDTYLNA